jgi:hypothetical protein
MNNELMYLVSGILIIVIVVMVWNNKNEGLYLPQIAPNQVYQGDYTNPMTSPNPRKWQCPPGLESPYCCQPGKSGEVCRMTKGRRGELPLGEGVLANSSDEGYRYSGTEPVSDRVPINIIAPPFTNEVAALSMGKGEGIFGKSWRNTSPMLG